MVGQVAEANDEAPIQKIARSRVLGVCACCKHNQSIDIVEKMVSMRFELLKITC